MRRASDLERTTQSVLFQIVIMEDQGIFESPYGKLASTEIEGGDHSVVISVVENRAREISICKIDTQSVSFCFCSLFIKLLHSYSMICPSLQNSSLEIFLLSDNHSYNEAIGTIKTICPDEVSNNYYWMDHKSF